MAYIVVFYSEMASLSNICRSTSWLRCFSWVIISLHARSQCESLWDLKGTTRMALEPQWYAKILCWLPMQEIIGNLPVLYVYSLMMCSMWMWSPRDGLLGGPTVGVMVWIWSNLGFVDRTSCIDWKIPPMMIFWRWTVFSSVGIC